MQRIVFDCETTALVDNPDGYGKTVHALHMIAMADADSTDSPVLGFHDDPALPRDGTIADAIEILNNAEVIIAHNALGFDVPHLARLAGLKPKKVLDTLVMARLAFSDRREQDYELWPAGSPHRKNIGSHSLRAWGLRLDGDDAKLDYVGDFSVLDAEMLKYGLQDVVVGRQLFQYLEPLMPDSEAMGYSTCDLEHKFALMLLDMEERGLGFDEKAAEDLLARMIPRKLELERMLHEAFPPRKELYKTNVRTGKRTQRRNDEGVMVDHRLVPFNPGSRLELARRLEKKYGWVPARFTDDRKMRPAMQEEILLELADIYDEAKLAAELYVLNARIGILENGKGSYLNMAVNGRVHGRCTHVGTITHRCAHSRPNLGNSCSISKPWGREIRSLWVPYEGHVMAGADASGLELRMLGHYLAKWDGGVYADEVANGDVHQRHADAFNTVKGVNVSRSEGKRSTYAILYGSGDENLGRINGGSRVLGRAIRRAFADEIKGMDPLLKALEHFRRTTGNLKSLDGRRVAIRHSHAALNTLLQSAGATVIRWWTVLLEEECIKRGMTPGKDWCMVAHVHDEIQASLDPKLQDAYTDAVNAAFTRTSKALGLRLDLAGDTHFGPNWASTH